MNEKEYCRSLGQEVMAIFEQTLRAGKDRLADSVPGPVDELIEELMSEAHQEVEKIPYIGGDENPFTPNLANAAPMVALFRVLEKHGLEQRKAGSLSVELTRLYYERVPPKENLAALMSDRFAAGDAVPRWAARSREHHYPDDFRYSVVWNDEEGGADFHECAILKFFTARGLEDYVPYLCAQDALVSDIYRQGLRRTTTLAEGGNRCDFRYAPGRKTDVKSTVL